jgi:glycosyltransferase involved in cell wall biosynthesis
MQKQLPVSICMISGAEAHRIGRALESVSGWAAEIIVVLNEEIKDGTEEICRKYQVKLFREPWKGHIAQKNSAAAKAIQPWILGLDADEVVSPDLRDEIYATLADAARIEAFAAFSCPRLSWYCGRWIRHGDWHPDRKVRLWRRGRACWGGLDPHDRLEVEGPVGKLRHDLRHYSNESIAQQIAKIAPYHMTFVQQAAGSGRAAGLLEFTVRPWWRFLRAYIFRLGLLDGWQGFYIAALSSFSTLTRYALLREAREQKRDRT